MKHITLLIAILFSFTFSQLQAQPNLDPTCEDLTLTNGDDNFPGIYGGSDISLNYDGSPLEVSLGTYGFFNNAQEGQTLFSVNGSAPVSLEDIGFDITYIAGVAVSRDPVLSWEVDGYFLANSNLGFNGIALTFMGEISNIVMTQFESGLVFNCQKPIVEIDECYYDFQGDDGTGYIFLGTHPFSFNGNQQSVDMGYFDHASWEQQSQEWPSDKTYFSVNGSDMIALDSILETQPFLLGDISITVDTNALAPEYVPQEGMTSGIISFTGPIELILTRQVESGIAYICADTEATVLTGCEDFTSDDDPVGVPGIYTVGLDVPLSYGDTAQVVSLGVYGFFNGWTDPSDLGQANGTFFSVNGSAAISLEEIYSNMPYTIEGVEISVDSSSLVADYDVSTWDSGTVIFSGEISEIVMTQFESGLLFSCVAPLVLEEVDCGIDADFSYLNLGSYFTFVSSGTGSDYLWDFGDGSGSTDSDPNHQYGLAGDYTVCLTNFNQGDSCSITLCQEITVPELGLAGGEGSTEMSIFTPNSDGVDDEINLLCGNVTIYDRNGQVVATLTEAESWNGRDQHGTLLPMGEYFLHCRDTDGYRKITSIW